VVSKFAPGSDNSLIFVKWLFESSNSGLERRKFFHDALKVDIVRRLKKTSKKESF
jgi:hypothetical protein